jgi:hypothetical protein
MRVVRRRTVILLSGEMKGFVSRMRKNVAECFTGIGDVCEKSLRG